MVADKLDDVWEDTQTKDDPQARAIRRNMYVQRGGYRLWTAIYIVAVITLVALPGLTAILGFSGDLGVKGLSTLAAISSLAGALVCVSRPETEVRRYEAAVQFNQAARTEYIAGNKKEAQRLLRHAIALTTPDAVILFLP